MNICPQCGEELKKKKNKVCPHCGYDLKNDPKGLLSETGNPFMAAPQPQVLSSQQTFAQEQVEKGKKAKVKTPRKKDPNGFGSLMTPEEREAFMTEGFHISMLLDTPDENYLISPRDIRANKDISMLCYLPFLFWIPLFARPGSRFARFHANQGLLLSIVELVWWTVEIILSKYFNDQLLYFLTILLLALNLIVLVLIGFGIINCSNGRAKELPIIGQYRIIPVIRPYKNRR